MGWHKEVLQFIVWLWASNVFFLLSNLGYLAILSRGVGCVCFLNTELREYSRWLEHVKSR